MKSWIFAAVKNANDLLICFIRTLNEEQARSCEIKTWSKLHQGFVDSTGQWFRMQSLVQIISTS